MPAVESIGGKRPQQFFKPKGAQKHQTEAYERFVEAVGDSGFHSLQLWRRTALGRASKLFALSIEQIEKLCSARDTKVKRLEAKAKRAQHLIARGKGIAAGLEDELAFAKERCAEQLALEKAETQSAQELVRVKQRELDAARVNLDRRDQVIRDLSRSLHIDDQPIFDALNKPQLASSSVRPIYTPMGGQPGFRRR